MVIIFSVIMQRKVLALVLASLFVGTILSAGISFQVLDPENIKNESNFMTLSSWSVTEIDNMTSSSMGLVHDSAVVVDSSGGVHVAYVGQPGYDLKYAHFDGNNWNTTVVDYANGSTTGVDEGISIDLDSNGFIGDVKSIKQLLSNNQMLDKKIIQDTNFEIFLHYNGSLYDKIRIEITPIKSETINIPQNAVSEFVVTSANINTSRRIPKKALKGCCKGNVTG